MTKVFINPGHDQLDLKGTPDYDPGAVNYDIPLYENEVAWNVGNLVAQYLEAAGCECKVFQNESLRRIYDTANDWNADYFVSIHCNAFNGVANGTETLTYPSDVQGYKLATAIQNQIVNSLGTNDRGIKARTDLAVLNGTDMPAVLVELAFIDEEDDAALLRDDQDEFARAVARGVTDFLSGV
jgi:N-acetylmuramoyl-L-alanine amidase